MQHGRVRLCQTGGLRNYYLPAKTYQQTIDRRSTSPNGKNVAGLRQHSRDY